MSDKQGYETPLSMKRRPKISFREIRKSNKYFEDLEEKQGASKWGELNHPNPGR